MRWGLIPVVALTLALGACGGEPFPTTAPTSTSNSTSTTLAPGHLSPDAPTATPVVHRPPITPVYGESTQPGSVVEPDEAHDVALQLWNERVQARYYRDAKGLAKLETGPVLAADVGYICLLGCRGPLLAADNVVVNVPHQQQWPLAFSANAFYTQGCKASQLPCHDSFVVVQSARNEPWKIAHYVTYAGTTFADEPASLGDGWAESPSPSSILTQAPADYAANLTALSRGAEPPAGTHLLFDWFGMDAPDAQRAERNLGPLGLEQTLTYRVDPGDPVWTFAGSHSAQFACGTVRFRQVVTGAGNTRFVQPPDLSSLGDKVPAGIYTRVTLDGVHMACFEQHVDDDALHVLGEWGDVTAIHAEK